MAGQKPFTDQGPGLNEYETLGASLLPPEGRYLVSEHPYPNLFSPFKLRGLTLPNRLVISAMPVAADALAKRLSKPIPF